MRRFSRHNSFLGTLLASASDKDMQYLVSQGPDYDDESITAKCARPMYYYLGFEKSI